MAGLKATKPQDSATQNGRLSPSPPPWRGVSSSLAVPAHAHGFGQRYDLPLPLSLYLFGTAAAVVLSFVIVGLFARRAPGASGYPGVHLLARPLDPQGRAGVWE